MDSFYPEKFGFDHSRHDMAFSMSRSMRSMNNELTDRSCINHTTEIDGKSRNPQRRRVPIACGRCRKRKIKCSGDSGDGQGCTNCRSAGNTDCQFLRMHSLSLPTKQWPYPVETAAAHSPRLAPDLYTHAPGKPTLMSMNSPQTRMATFQRTQDFDLGTENVFQRPMMGSEPIHYEDEQANFSMSPPYLQSNAPFMDYEPSNWSQKPWDPIFTSRSSANGGIYTEPEQSTFYMLPSHISNDISQAIVVSSPEAGSDRTLPTPTCQSQQVPTNDRLSRTLPRNNNTIQRHLALSEGAAEIYGYTSTEKSKRGNGGGDSRYSGATLMNGLPYTRVPHRDMPTTSFALNVIPDALSDYQRVVENAHRPVEPLRNQGAY